MTFSIDLTGQETVKSEAVPVIQFFAVICLLNVYHLVRISSKLSTKWYGDRSGGLAYSRRISSTSKMRVELGGMTPGWPCWPYAKSGVHVSLARSPTDI